MKKQEYLEDYCSPLDLLHHDENLEKLYENTLDEENKIIKTKLYKNNEFLTNGIVTRNIYYTELIKTVNL